MWECSNWMLYIMSTHEKLYFSWLFGWKTRIIVGLMMIDEHHTMIRLGFKHDWHYRSDLVARFSLTGPNMVITGIFRRTNPSVCNKRVIFTDKKDHMSKIIDEFRWKRFILDQCEKISIDWFETFFQRNFQSSNFGEKKIF